MEPDADPGWGRAISFALRGVVPGWSLRYRKQRWSGAHGLLVLRGVFLSFAIGIAMVGVVVAVLEGTAGEMGSVPEPAAAAVVVAVGVACLAAPRLFSRPLPCDSESALGAAYRQRFFLRIAFGEAPALVSWSASSRSSRRMPVGSTPWARSSPRSRSSAWLRRRGTWKRTNRSCGTAAVASRSSPR